MAHDTPERYRSPFTVERHTWCPTSDDRETLSNLAESLARARWSVSEPDAAYVLAVVRDGRGLMVFAADSTGKTWDRAEAGTTPPVRTWREEVSSC